MSSEKDLRKALKLSIRTQESMLRTLKELGDKSPDIGSLSLRLLINHYKKYLEKLKKVLEA